MCTLTYIPLENEHYIITSNRDESNLRKKALPPEVYQLNNNKLIFPKDPVGGGSWIATSENGLTACLLNGAYEPHIPLNQYKKSRGLIVLDLFKYKDPIQFGREINLKGIEPFTLVMIYNYLILELKWTGNTKNFRFLERSLPHIWVSEQLYSKENIKNRKTEFQKLILGNNFSQDEIIKFHELLKYGNKVIEPENEGSNNVETLSITSIEINKFAIKLYYKELNGNSVYRIEI